MDGGVHRRRPERETLTDFALMRYEEALREEYGEILTALVEKIQQPTKVQCNQEEGDLRLLEEGWAIKAKRKFARFSEKQKAFLKGVFDKGQRESEKLDGKQAARAMKKAKKEDGSAMFMGEEYLTPLQCASYFSRLAAALRRGELTGEVAQPPPEENVEKNEDGEEGQEIDPKEFAGQGELDMEQVKTRLPDILT